MSLDPCRMTRCTVSQFRGRQQNNLQIIFEAEPAGLEGGSVILEGGSVILEDGPVILEGGSVILDCFSKFRVFQFFTLINGIPN